MQKVMEEKRREPEWMKMEIESRSENEEFARVVVAVFASRLNPTLEEIDAYAHTPLWPQLRAYLAAAYGAGPRLEYSRCGLEPGWNVKFRSVCLTSV